MHFHGPSAEDRKGDTKLIVEQPQSNCLALNLLLFTLQQTLAAADTNLAAADAQHSTAAAPDEEDGDDGQDSLESVAAFSKTEVQEDRKALLCLSCRE